MIYSHVVLQFMKGEPKSAWIYTVGPVMSLSFLCHDACLVDDVFCPIPFCVGASDHVEVWGSGELIESGRLWCLTPKEGEVFGAGAGCAPPIYVDRQS